MPIIKPIINNTSGKSYFIKDHQVLFSVDTCIGLEVCSSPFESVRIFPFLTVMKLLGLSSKENVAVISVKKIAIMNSIAELLKNLGLNNNYC